jgi:protein ImuB
VVAEVPDGPPWRFRWRRTLHQVARVEGPERIAPEWWRLGDGRLSGGLTRDYFRVEDQAGGRYWIFRRGLYGSEARAPAWYLHGLFA